MQNEHTYDVMIIGGGPAGLSAAMVLGRCRRKVILFDTHKQRNRFSDAMNGFITRDGIKPSKFIEIAREELVEYHVVLRAATIKKVHHTKGGFEAEDEVGEKFRSKKLLLATGLKDRVPEIPGIEKMYGKSVHHCPYCDGWESRDKPIAAYGKNRNGVGLALSLKTWSDHVTLFTDGTDKLTSDEVSQLKRNGIGINKKKIARLEGEETQLKQIVLDDDTSEKCEAMFFSTGTDQQCDLGNMLGCEFTRKGVVKTRKLQKTNVKGLFVAGDASRDVQLVIVAAAEGTKAAVAINMELQEEDRQ
ncbi:NAD(P)/FAD-dependent oxidoreductase [Adhaeribacter terreus]|uniref:NAD(P)/FAD-dependent oxidoreductase n=1 Tax=Adhaeribacter terreus TaxID=529703 RepID=A0ABW0EEL6_9BACT